MNSFGTRRRIVGVLGIIYCPLAACSSSPSGRDAAFIDIGVGRDADPVDMAPLEPDASRFDAQSPDANPDAARDAGMTLFDTGSNRFDAQFYDAGGDLPPGFSTDCERMAQEGCVTPLEPPCSGGMSRIEYDRYQGQVICRCRGWPIVYWEAGNGYRQQCDGTFRNRCREDGPLEASCEAGLICTGASTSGPPAGVERGWCLNPCADPNRTQECVELAPEGCCRRVEGGLRACIETGTTEGCPYPQFNPVGCGEPDYFPWCP